MAKIMLFGDSILGGFTNGKLTNKVTNSLKQAFPTDAVVNLSSIGANTDHALSTVNHHHLLEANTDIIILNLGVNDASVKKAMSAGRYNNNLNLLVEKIGPSKIILISPSFTNWRVAEDQSWPRILQFELVTEQVAQKYQLPYLNLAELMQQNTKPLNLLQNDGIHLSDDGIKLLIQNLVPLIKTKLNTIKE